MRFGAAESLLAAATLAALFANDGKAPARPQMYANQIYVGKRPQPPVPLPRAPAVKRQR